MERIPTKVIGNLSSILPDWYSHAGIDSLFLYAGAPDDVPDVSKPKKVESWLRSTNKVVDEPLSVLEVILEDFFEKPLEQFSAWMPASGEPQDKLDADKRKLESTLAGEGLMFSSGKLRPTRGSSSTLSLEEEVRRHGLSSVDQEIKRALRQVDKDPHAAAHYAGNVLEAAFKAYLDKKAIKYSPSHTLSELWKTVAKDIGLQPGELKDKDLRKIASGMHSVVDGIMYLRNKKSGAHGKSEIEARNYKIAPRHARLAINAAHTIAAYVLEVAD
ncbi:abortive infection family protein [Pseudophaeobacter sp. 1A16562]|uniref:abortive infection family protein n=1 Tax=Pseudophaeobacter sp. 1A16562 TaxID=3098143 RepID=UPI0034D43106